MYDSGITAAELITMVKSEADISVTIPDASWLGWINEVEQTLYTEVIKELKIAVLEDPTSPIDIEDIVPDDGEGQAIFEDIVMVLADGRALQKASVISSLRFNKSIWYKSGSAIGFSLASNGSSAEMKIVYCVRPELKVMTTVTPPALPALPDTKIALPHEFAELMACRLRGEAYKIANDDAQAGKWISDYNAYVENFKVWVKRHNAGFGE